MQRRNLSGVAYSRLELNGRKQDGFSRGSVMVLGCVDLSRLSCATYTVLSGAHDWETLNCSSQVRLMNLISPTNAYRLMIPVKRARLV